MKHLLVLASLLALSACVRDPLPEQMPTAVLVPYAVPSGATFGTPFFGAEPVMLEAYAPCEVPIEESGTHDRSLMSAVDGARPAHEQSVHRLPGFANGAFVRSGLPPTHPTAELAPEPVTYSMAIVRRAEVALVEPLPRE